MTGYGGAILPKTINIHRKIIQQRGNLIFEKKKKKMFFSFHHHVYYLEWVKITLEEIS